MTPAVSRADGGARANVQSAVANSNTVLSFLLGPQQQQPQQTTGANAV